MSKKPPKPPGSLTDIRFGKDIGEEELFSYPRFEELRTMLRLSVSQRSFSLVTGKAGIGKTTAVRSFTSELPGSRYQIIYFGQDQDGTGLLKRFALLLGLQPRYLRHQVAMQISQTLADNVNQGGRELVAVFDEAHLLDAETLEDIRLLSNSNFDTSSALSIILLGQQQLRAHLKDPRLEALNQRLTYRFFLEGFTFEETAAYIKHRVETAGGSADVFTDDAIHRIFDASEGVPREINNLCSLALLKAQTNSVEEVDGKLVKQLVSQRESQLDRGRVMLKILFTAQCDVCGNFLEQMLVCTTAKQNECAIQAGSLIEAAEIEGWFFNSKTRKFWCVDCILSLTGNEMMPPVEQIKIPGLTFA